MIWLMALNDSVKPQLCFSVAVLSAMFKSHKCYFKLFRNFGPISKPVDVSVGHSNCWIITAKINYCGIGSMQHLK